MLTRFPIAIGMLIAFIILWMIVLAKGIFINLSTADDVRGLIWYSFLVGLTAWLLTAIIARLRNNVLTNDQYANGFLLGMSGSLIVYILALMVGVFKKDFDYFNNLVFFGEHILPFILLGSFTLWAALVIYEWIAGGIGIVGTFLSRPSGWATVGGIILLILFGYWLLKDTNISSGSKESVLSKGKKVVEINEKSSTTQPETEQASPEAIADNGAHVDPGDSIGEATSSQSISVDGVTVSQETAANGSVTQIIQDGAEPDQD